MCDILDPLGVEHRNEAVAVQVAVGEQQLLFSQSPLGSSPNKAMIDSGGTR